MTASELGSRAVDPPPWTKWQPCYRSTPINGPTLGLVAEWRSVPKAAVSNCKKIDLYTKAPVTRLVIIPCLSIRVLPDVARFSGHPNTTEGGDHNTENTSSLCTRGNELRDRADADDRHPADPALRDGRAGLPARHGIAPIRLLNVTRG